MLALGLCIGSFLGVLVYRLPYGISPWNGRSVCEACGTSLGAYDLVPVLSFVWLGGRCRTCHTPIRRELFAIEIAAALVTVPPVLLLPDLYPMLCVCFLGWGLLALGWIDARHFYLPDAITLPFILTGLAVTWWFDPADLGAHLVGAASGYLVFRGVNEIYKAIRHRDGIGQGDAKLLALAGSWLGWQPLPWVVIGAAFLGIILAILLRLLKRGELTTTTRLPFGACLAPMIYGAYIFLMTTLHGS